MRGHAFGFVHEKDAVDRLGRNHSQYA
jgi:hypothetical protein